MTDPQRPDDLGSRLPLNGVQWIEASAGTGKTFIVATLYARLIIEVGLPVPTVLAVTFTEAATAELRERLRARLVLAQAIAEERAVVASSEHAATAPLVAAAIEREGQAALQRRLRLAVEAMDLAPIHTIHGFCRRALADHALEAGQPLVERAIVENERLLLEEVATDYWRDCSIDSARTHVLLSLWKSPAELANDLRVLLTVDELRPRSSAFEPEGPLDASCAQAARAAAAAAREHSESAWRAIQTAVAAKAMHGNKFRSATANKRWQALQDWLASGMDDEPDPDIGYFSTSSLAEKTRQGQAPPVSPLFDAIETWVAVAHGMAERDQQRRIALVHDARAFARARLDALKHERGLIGYDDMVRGVDEALSSATGDDFVERLRAQYRVALVDEFQDTDPRQWSIFRRLFVEARDLERALFLIGDPKQAIYRFRGGDVYTYLEARICADQRHALTRNFRSRPSAIAAVETLFGGDNAFAQPGIEFHPVAAGGQVSDDDLQLDGAVLPGLNFEMLTDLADANIEAARDAATTACVARIHQLLAAGLEHRACRRGRDGVRPLAPGDIAVLVATNNEADRIAVALSAAGIPCVAAGRNSLYKSEQAGELRVLLYALLEPADDRRLRAAMSMPVLGATAADLLAVDGDETARRHLQDRLQAWRVQCERFGPLALVGALCADNAPRLLALVDGERRLTNLLQLAEELQATRADRLGLAGLLDELERRILAADEYNDNELLRLESDAKRVKILTVHKSKGLEFDLVFLPYAATMSRRRSNGTLALARYHDDDQRVAELFADKASFATSKEADEEHAEDLRLLYVGLTRARLATWVVWGAVKGVVKTPLAWLLHREGNDPLPKSLDDAVVAASLRAIASPAIAVSSASTTRPSERLSFAPAEPTPAAAIARRQFDRDWWVYSFSQLAREDDGADSSGARDEIEPVAGDSNSRYVGARFGNALHTALEATDFAAWRDWSLELPPTGEYERLASALRGQGYASETDQLEGLPLLTRLVAATLNARMPEGAVLASLPPEARCPELEFHLAFRAVSMSTLIATLHAHGIVVDRNAFGLRQRIEGLLTGYIDLVYEYAGRYYVLDYKSNRLPDFTPPTLAKSVRENEYDLQYTLYSLALHRWLRFRLGAAYDYDTHMGGVRYLYCRGLADGEGVHALTLPRALIESLDELMTAP